MIKLRTKHSRRGVALIVTIGLLAVLILLAISFSISMRVERLAARNFADVIQARQWTESALALAMAETETHIGTQPFLPAGDNQVYLMTGGSGPNVSPRLYSQSVTNYIPSSLKASADKDVGWKDAASKYANGKPVARYAYQVIDCSGFIDANFGGLTNVPSSRGVATNAMDIWLDESVLTEIAPGQAGNVKKGLKFTVATATSPWWQFSSFADLWTVGYDGGSGSGVFKSMPANFFTYSHFPPGYANAASLAAAEGLFLGHTQQYWDANKATIQQDIRNKLQTMSGVTDPDTLAANIIDYCDADDIPQLSVRDNFSNEATPLLNEFLFDFTLQSAGSGKYRLECKPHVECWYPFAGYTNKNAYEAQVILQFGGDAKYTGTVQTPYQAMTPPGGTWDYNNGDDIWKYDSYPVLSVPTGTDADTLPDLSKIDVAISGRIKATSGGTIVDFVFQRTMKLPFLSLVPGDTRTAGIAIDDPRFNSQKYNQWKETGAAPGGKPSTLGLMNDATIMTHDKASADFVGVAGKPWVFWPNRVLQTTGELGLQAYDPTKAWTTVSLLGPSATQVPVLDRFFVSSNKQGKISLNTWDLAVLKTAFNNCPVSGYPGQSAATLSSTARDTIAGQVDVPTYLNMSDFSQVSVNIGGLDRMQSEGVIRDTAEILGVRQNVFTILVAAQALSDNGNVLGEQRALAVVWRDPYADSSGYHPSFIRSLRWLNE